MPKWFGYLENILQENKYSEWFAGNKMSVADLAIWRLLGWIISGKLDHIPTTILISFPNLTKLYKNVNKGSNNEEAKKKIEEAHVYATKAGNEGQLFFKSVTAIFSSGSFEDAAAATEVASRTKGNLNYFYKALREIREAKNVNLTPETKEEFGAAEDSIEI